MAVAVGVWMVGIDGSGKAAIAVFGGASATIAFNTYAWNGMGNQLLLM
jgi:hypothetical protein